MIRTKKLTGADALLCIMSGNFTQRAESAIMDKYERAKVAVLCGADVVVGLPTPYSANNAEVFALAAVKIANSFKNVKFLSFGMEEPNLPLLNELADFFIKESEQYKLVLKNFLKLGNSFNESRVKTVEELINNGSLNFSDNKKALELLTMPNNILALEYVKALRQTNSTIAPVAVKRLGSNYNEQKLEGEYSSATAIRKAIFDGNIKNVQSALPKPSFLQLQTYLAEHSLINAQKLQDLALYKIRTSKKSQLKKLYNMNEGLENRLKNIALSVNNAREFLEEIKTKRYKDSKINSLLLNAVLNIEKSVVTKIYQLQKLPYIKVLAVNANNKQLLSKLKCSSRLILRKSDAKKLKLTTFTKELMQAEDNSNAVYNLLLNKQVLASSDIHTPVLIVSTKSE
jgi:predicted nucleotidyltransferase